MGNDESTMGACMEKEEPESSEKAQKKGSEKKWAYKDKPAGVAKTANSADTSKTTPSGKTRDPVKVADNASTSGYVTGAASTKGYEKTKAWVEKKLGEKLDDDLWEWAHDGHRLCKLANVLKPGSVDMSKLNKSKTIALHCQMNISKATEAFKVMLPANQQSRLFRSPDLYERGSSYPKQIWICLSALE